jgi:hypothetical protein
MRADLDWLILGNKEEVWQWKLVENFEACELQ